MSRSGCAYIHGKRGVKFLHDLLAALDNMRKKALIAREFDQNGAVCALGALGKARRLDMTDLDPNEPGDVSRRFGIPRQLAREVAYVNDEGGGHKEKPEKRWVRMRAWTAEQIRKNQTKE